MRIFVIRTTRMNAQTLFQIQTQAEFHSAALAIFKFQYQKNLVYQEFCNHLKKTPSQVKQLDDIPFLPIEFFKSKQLISDRKKPEILFTSSGTTGSKTSTHYVTDIQLYEKSYLKAFEQFYGNISEYCVLALLPSYLEREGSSLIYMVDDLIKKSKHTDGGFYLGEIEILKDKLVQLDNTGNKVLLIGVSFALLDFAEKHQLQLKNTIVMETGGMKGRRKELIREELHAELKKGFGVQNIHSEYGMTELLSQAYSSGDGIFKTPPWMKVLTRDTEDPLSMNTSGKTGGINIIDLANKNSCAFIATQDLGKVYEDGSFEVLGRYDSSDIRGCNLMIF